MLSRLSVYSEQMALQDDDDGEPTITEGTLETAMTIENLQRETLEDEELAKVKTYRPSGQANENRWMKT